MGAEATGGADASDDSGGSSDDTAGGFPECTDETTLRASGVLDWAFGVGTDLSVFDLNLDGEGSSISTGALTRAVFEGNVYDAALTGRSGFAAKHDSDGALQWVYSSERGLTTAVIDSAGDILTGSLGPNNLIKLDGTTGEPIWSTLVSDPAYGRIDVWDIALVPNGDMILLGTILTTSDMSNFVVRVDADGNQLWSRELESTADVYPMGLTYVDGGITWLGAFHGTLDLESGDIPADAMGVYVPLDLAVIRLDDDGNVEWGTSPVDSRNAWEFYLTGYAADPCGGFYGYGLFRGVVEVGVDTLVSGTEGLADLFLIRFDAAGGVEWARRYGPAGTASRIAVDAAGNVFLTGSIVHGDFGPDVLDTESSEGFVAMINREGDALWAEAFEGEAGSLSSIVAVDDHGRVIVSAGYSAGITIGDTVLEFDPMEAGYHAYFASFDY